jgi:hypothetical protein
MTSIARILNDIMINELKGLYEEVAMAWFKVLSWYLAEGTEKTTKKK